MLFKKLSNMLKNNNTNAQAQNSTPSNPNNSKQKSERVANEDTPSSDYKKENEIIVLWWISKKKSGYEVSSNKYPKWFKNTYGIDFNIVVNRYVSNMCLSNENDIVKITEKGQDLLKEYSYVIFIYEHSDYELTFEDFTEAPNFHKVKDSDIAWGVFNSRLQNYISAGMWKSLTNNYSNMADLLVEEKRYSDALEYVFATAYLETSGMLDDNELTAIMDDYKNGKSVDTYLENGMPDIFLLEINNYFVTVPFLKIQKAMNYEWNEIKERFLKSKIIESLEKLIPFRYFEKEESFEIFKEAVIAGNKKGVFKLKDVSKKLKYNMPNKNSKKYLYLNTENQMKKLGY